MVLVVALLVKPFPTELTDPWLESRVDADMSVESRGPIETFATSIASVRLLLCMDYLVSAEGTRLTKSLPAYLANEWSGSCVDWHVSSQVVMGIENFPTVITFKNLWFFLRR